MAAIRSAMTAADEEAIIKTRFLTGASATRGEPPLKKLAKRFVQLADGIEAGSDAKTDDLLRLLLREISLMELQGIKMQATCEANLREQQSYLEKQRQLEEDIEQAKRDIESKKLELQDAKVERQHKEQFEVLRAIAMETPARATTLQSIQRIEGSIQHFTEEGLKYTLALEKRRKDFALLFHVLEELKWTTDDDGTGGSGRPATAATVAAAGGGGGVAAGPRDGGEAQPMDVEAGR